MGRLSLWGVLVGVVVVGGPVAGETLPELWQQVTSNYRYRVARLEEQRAKAQLKEAEAKSFGKVELSYRGVHYFQQPVMKFSTQVPVAVGPNGVLIYQPVESQLPMGGQNQWEGEISYSYPLFTGFRLEALRRWKGLEVVKKRLERENIRRQLILKVTQLYSQLYRLKAQIGALERGLVALQKGVEEGEGFYREGLIDRASLESLRGKYWELKGELERAKGEWKRGLELLSGLVGKRVSKIEGLPELPPIEVKLEHRPDIAQLKVAVGIGKAQLQLAKGEFYPEVGVKVWWKRIGEVPGLAESRYFNSNRSGVGIELRYPLYTGGERRGKVEEAQIGRLERVEFYRGYLKEAKRQLAGDLAQIRGLKEQLAGAEREVEARRARLEVVEGKFREQLVTGRVLAEAIADLAKAESRVEGIKGELLFWQVKGLLDSGGWTPPGGEGGRLNRVGGADRNSLPK